MIASAFSALEFFKRRLSQHLPVPLVLPLAIGLFATTCLLHGQDVAPASSSSVQASRQDSQKMPLLPIKGTSTLLSAYPTRTVDFEAFVRESGYQWDHKPHFPQSPDHPVVNITLQDAAAYCEWLTKKERASGAISDIQSYRLPTNREWDAAVGLASAQTRAMTADEEIQESRTFPWGLQWPPPPKSGNFNSFEIDGTDDGYPYTSPVGSFTVNAQGFYDMAGNVWQWAWDRDDPLSTGGVLRGGSWMYFRKECLISNYRYQVPADLRAPSVGFRYVFEDKHETAIFLANQQKVRAEEDKQQRSMLTTNSKDVTQEEIAKMRAGLESRRAQNTTASPASPVPDPATLKPAQADTPFTNSLGMSFRPIGLPHLLFGETEVRVQDYEAGKAWAKRPTFAIQPTHPVVNITWADANAYAEWLTTRDRDAKLIGPNARYRLPTDAEWSQAVGLKDESGSDPAQKDSVNTDDYPWGRSQWPPPTLSANLDTGRMTGYFDSFSYTSPVGSFSPNSFSIHDLGGNAAEWTADSWPGVAGERVIRGSSWISAAKEDTLSSKRQHLPETTTMPQVGFRLVLDLGQN